MPEKMTVQGLLDTKGTGLYAIGPDETVFEALKILSEAKIGALPVIKDGKLVGIFSERDYARKIILEGKASKDTPIREIMTTNVSHVGPGQSVKECMTLMTKSRFRHLPVIKDGAVIGVISIGDVVRAILMSLL